MKKTGIAILIMISVMSFGITWAQDAIIQDQDLSQTQDEVKADSCSTDSIITVEEDSVYTDAEVKARFPGGLGRMGQWLERNIRYPENAMNNNVQGRVFVRFIVEKDGSITNAKVLENVDPDLDEEALRLIYKMPKWEPAKNNGEPVRSWAVNAFNFRVQTK